MRSRNIDHWAATFPVAKSLSRDDFALVSAALSFPMLPAGAVAYEEEGACENYLMCLEGRTRITKRSLGGREMLLYKVETGGTCVLTTQCLLSHTTFPAESVAEAETTLAAVPAASFYRFMAEVPVFRDFVIADYSRLLGAMFSMVDTLAFATVEQRLARRLLAEADEAHVVGRTHQQLAAEVGSVRENVSRHLGDWERRGWVRNGRGQITILDRAALATRQAG